MPTCSGTKGRSRVVQTGLRCLEFITPQKQRSEAKAAVGLDLPEKEGAQG